MTKHTGLEATVRNALGAAVMCGLLSACAVTPDAIRALPELPAEFAKDLAPARTAPVLMTKPATAAPTVAPPPSTGPIFAIARACTAIYEGYVIYPITVCYPPTALYETLVVGAVEAPAPSGKVPVLPAKYFKLSSHPQARIGGPWFCVVRGGPWYGHVEGQQFCNANPNIRSFKADILGAPEPVVVIWSGTLSDVPPPLNLLGIQQTGEFCVCCSGIMCPDGTCKLDPQQCGVMPPAVK